MLIEQATGQFRNSVHSVLFGPLPSVQKEETSTNKGYEKPVKNH